MIVSRITDGLGNQLFQYAAGRALSLRHQVPLSLDLTYYRPIQQATRQNTALHSIAGAPRTLQLPFFNITAKHIRPVNLLRFLFAPTPPVNLDKNTDNLPTDDTPFTYSPRSWTEQIAQWLIQRNRLTRLSPRTIKQQGHDFDSSFESWPDSSYLCGYWESENFFRKIRPVLQRELTLRTPVTGDNAECLNRIDQSQSVSIHVRRGDNLRPTGQAIWGLLSMNYYENSIRTITTCVAQPRFFVFSDDPQWAAANLKHLPNTEFIRWNDEDHAYLDLFLMRHCKHHIVANSTFSWWGAWLSDSPNKIVCAPTPWFNAKERNTRSLVPESWKKIER